jgi:drug/metabolite transporter (DMT)-like permease
MISISIAIITVTWIFIIFKSFPKYNINTFQAVVFNYLAAFSCGTLLYGNQITKNIFEHREWMVWAVICGALFISLFFMMGKSSQNNGVSLTTVVVKMSMAFSMILMIIIYHEDLTIYKIAAILLALAGIFFLSKEKQNTEKKNNDKILLIILFIGCGLLDFVLNYVQNFKLQHISSPLFSAFGLGLAGVIGCLILIIKSFKSKEKVTINNIIAGILLGVPNYFSIYYLIHSYEVIDLPDSTVLALLNVLSVLASLVVGYFIFKEKITWLKAIGIFSCLVSIYLFTKG